MKLIDANVLLYAINSDAPHHRESKKWLDDSLNGEDAVGFASIVLLAFIRLSTHPRVFDRPWSAAQACTQVEAWLSAHTAVLIEPGTRNLTIMADLLAGSGTAGNLTSDAHLAALAIEHRASVATFDRDFERFGVSIHIPGKAG